MYGRNAPQCRSGKYFRVETAHRRLLSSDEERSGCLAAVCANMFAINV